jgi:Predicted pyridoxal phosphate-dependent enzyme apparently involved in regulation of cell wall biogenesis
MICTGDEEMAEKAAVLRQNGMSKGAWNRYAAKGSANYDIFFPGLKYTMMDIQAAIGDSQLRELGVIQFKKKRDRLFLYGRTSKSQRTDPSKACTMGARAQLAHFTPFIDIDSLGMSRDDFMSE